MTEGIGPTILWYDCYAFGAENTQLVGNTHNLGHRSGAHLAHDLSTMDLHRDLAHIEISRDLLVHPAGDDKRQDLPFTRCQRVVTGLKAHHHNRLIEPGAALLDRQPDRVE